MSQNKTVAQLDTLAAADAASAANQLLARNPSAAANTRNRTVRFDVLMGALARLKNVFVVTDPKYGATGDGTTDDTAAIRSALSAAAGKHLLFPAGTYLVDPTTTFSIGANTTIECAPGATIKLKANAQLAADGYAFTATQGSDNVTLVNFNFDGNRANQTKRLRGFVGFQVLGLRVIRPRVVDCSGTAVNISNCPGAIIDLPDVQRCGRTGSSVTAEQGIGVLNDVALGTTYYATGCEVRGGSVVDCGLDGIIFTAPQGRVHGVKTTGNGVDKDAAGIWVSGTYVGGTIIESNYVASNTGNGIDSGAASALSTRPKGVIVRNNRCTLNGRSGINVDDHDWVTVEDNECWNNHTNTAGSHGQRGGISFSTNWTVNRAWIRRNKCYDDRGGSATQKWGIQLGSASTYALTEVVCEDNDLDLGNTAGAIGSEYGSAPVNFVTSASTYFSARRNKGYTPTVTTTIAGGTAIPLVQDGQTVSLGSTTNILGIRTARPGDVFTLIFGNGNTTLKASGGTLILLGGTDFTPTAGDAITFVYDGTNSREISRARQSFIPSVTSVGADRGDNNITLTAGTDRPVQRFASVLTANRTVTLATTAGTVYNGARFRIVRTGLGAFTLDVGGLKTIPASTAAFVDVEYDGTAWRLTAYGTL